MSFNLLTVHIFNFQQRFTLSVTNLNGRSQALVFQSKSDQIYHSVCWSEPRSFSVFELKNDRVSQDTIQHLSYKSLLFIQNVVVARWDGPLAALGLIKQEALKAGGTLKVSSWWIMVVAHNEPHNGCVETIQYDVYALEFVWKSLWQSSAHWHFNLPFLSRFAKK